MKRRNGATILDYAVVISLIVSILLSGIAVFMMTQLSSFILDLSESLGPSSAPPIKIGLLQPITGSTGFAGLAAVRGVTMAAEEINEEGGILGRDIVLVVRDDAGDTEKAVTGAERLIAEDGVIAIIGTYASGNTIAAAEIVSKYKIPLLTPESASDGVTQLVADDYEKYKYIFRSCHLNVSSQQLPLYDFVENYLASKSGTKKVFFIPEKAKWAEEGAERGISWFEARGIECGISNVPYKSTEFAGPLTEAKYWEADVIWPIVSSEAGISFMNQYHDMQLPAVVVGQNTAGQRATCWNETGGKCVYQCLPLLAVRTALTENTLPFYERFNKRWGVDPWYTEINSYETLYVLAEAIERAGSTDSEAIITELEKTDYVGVIGRVKFTSTHDTFAGYGWRHNLVGQWQDGTQVIIWPEDLSTGTFQPPPWLE